MEFGGLRQIPRSAAVRGLVDRDEFRAESIVDDVAPTPEDELMA